MQQAYSKGNRLQYNGCYGKAPICAAFALKIWESIFRLGRHSKDGRADKARLFPLPGRRQSRFRRLRRKMGRVPVNGCPAFTAQFQPRNAEESSWFDLQG